MWQKFKQDFKERFLNFETAKGVYMVPAGLIGCYITIFHLNYMLQAVGILGFWYVFSEGMRKIAVNRIKQKVAREDLMAARIDKEINDNSPLAK